MRASQVLQKCLGDALDGTHMSRQRALSRPSETLSTSRRLILMDIARVARR